MTRQILFYVLFLFAHLAVLVALDITIEWYYLLLHLYFTGLSFILHLIFKKSGEGKRFVHFYMAFSGGKMFLSLFIILLFALFRTDELLPFALSTMGLYLAYTTTDSMWLFRALKKGK